MKHMLRTFFSIAGIGCLLFASAAAETLLTQEQALKVADRVPVVVAVDKMAEVGSGVRRGSRGKPNLDRVEVVKRVPPHGLLLGSVATMAFVCDYDVEGMDRDVEAVRVLVDRLIPDPEDRVAPEDIDRHSLDGAYVHEGVSGLRVGQVRRWHQLGIKLLLFGEIPPLESA